MANKKKLQLGSVQANELIAGILEKTIENTSTSSI